MHGETEAGKSRWRYRRRWEDYIKMDLRETQCEIVDYTELVEGTVQWRALMNKVTGIFVIVWIPISQWVLCNLDLVILNKRIGILLDFKCFLGLAICLPISVTFYQYCYLQFLHCSECSESHHCNRRIEYFCYEVGIGMPTYWLWMSLCTGVETNFPETVRSEHLSISVAGSEQVA
jgi:hypothetical protein